MACAAVTHVCCIRLDRTYAPLLPPHHPPDLLELGPRRFYSSESDGGRHIIHSYARYLIIMMIRYRSIFPSARPVAPFPRV
jgi:hypothetical protein